MFLSKKGFRAMCAALALLLGVSAAAEPAAWGSCAMSYADPDGDGVITATASAGELAAPGEEESWFSGEDGAAYDLVLLDGVAFPQLCTGLLQGAAGLRSVTSGHIDTSAAIDMSYMFCQCERLRSVETGGWDTSSVTDMSSMFAMCASLNALDVSGWDTSRVTSMEGMFSECASLTDLDLSAWDTSSVVSFCGMFEGCVSLTRLDLSGWDTSAAEDMSGMFSWNPALQEIRLGSKFVFDEEDGFSFPEGSWYSEADGRTYTAEEIASGRSGRADRYTFAGASGTWGSCPWTLAGGVLTVGAGTGPERLGASYDDDDFYGGDGEEIIDDTEEDMAPWEIYRPSKIVFEDGVVFPEYCGDLFAGCGAADIEFGNVNTSAVTNMDGMFAGCDALTSLDLSAFSTANVESMERMLACPALTSCAFGAAFVRNAGDDLGLREGLWRSEADGRAYAAGAIPAARGVADTYAFLVSEEEFTFCTPNSLNVIEEAAFAGTAARWVRVPEGCVGIGPRAFADCGALSGIWLPDSLTSIADDAFEGCDGLILLCAPGSAAHAFAEAKGLEWVEVGT